MRDGNLLIKKKNTRMNTGYRIINRDFYVEVWTNDYRHVCMISDNWKCVTAAYMSGPNSVTVEGDTGCGLISRMTAVMDENQNFVQYING